MWSSDHIDRWSTSTVGGVLLFSMLIWILQGSIAALLSFLYRRLVSPCVPRQTLPGPGQIRRSNWNRATFCSGIWRIFGVVWQFLRNVATGRLFFAQPSASRLGASGQTMAKQSDQARHAQLPDEVLHNGGRRGDGDNFGICLNRCKRRRIRNVGGMQTKVQVNGNAHVGSIDLEEKGKTVGLKTRVSDIMKKLETTPSLGLYGMGGVGKTTLARAVFKDLSLTKHFEYTCFIADTKEIVRKYSGKKLTSKLLEGLQFHGMRLTKMQFDWSTLKGKKVLLVVDDIDTEEQLQHIRWKSRWFGEESRMIITSRDKKLCERISKDLFHVEVLGREDSRQLFIHHAFEGSKMPKFLEEKSNTLEHILDLCGGVPLALEVVGKYLYKETDERIWLGALQKLREGDPIDGDCNNRLTTYLRLSYNALAEEEKQMFLDAAILFMGDALSETMEIWNASWGNAAHLSWRNLSHKNLVKDHGGKEVWVHEQLRIMARTITCPKYKKIQWWPRVGLPHECKKLFTSVLVEEPSSAEGVIYSPRMTTEPLRLAHFTFCQVRFPNLKVLKLRNIDILSGHVKNMNLPPQLVLFSWRGAPYVKCPFRLKELKHLITLELKHWMVLTELPDDFESSAALTRIQLKGCKALKELPYGLSNLKKLKFLGLEGTGIVKVPHFLGELQNLEILQLTKTNVSQLPSSIGNWKQMRVLAMSKTPLVELPPSFCCLLKLTSIDLCHTNVSFLPDALGDIVGLKKLNLSNTPVTKLPDSIGRLKELCELDLNSTHLLNLPECIGDMIGLERLVLGSTTIFTLPTSFSRLYNLRDLQLYCNALQCLPESMEGLKNLTFLTLVCNALQSLPDSLGNLEQLGTLRLSCNALQSLPKSLEHLKSADFFMYTKLESFPDTFNQLRAVKSLDDADSRRFSCLPEGFQHLPARCFPVSNRKTLQLQQLVGDTGDVQNLMSASENLDLDNYNDTPWHLLLQSSYRDLPRQRQQVFKLRRISITDRECVRQLPEHMLNVLHQIDTLCYLKLRNFDGVSSLPHEFGSLIPPSVFSLGLRGWRSLVELPESMGQITMLRDLCLTGCMSLRSLPLSLWELPHLCMLDLRSCKCLQLQSMSCVVDPLFSRAQKPLTVWMDHWVSFVNVVKCFGHLSWLRLEFWVRKANWVELTGLQLTVGESEWFRRAGIMECMKRMSKIYGDGASVGMSLNQDARLCFQLRLMKQLL